MKNNKTNTVFTSMFKNTGYTYFEIIHWKVAILRQCMLFCLCCLLLGHRVLNNNFACLIKNGFSIFLVALLPQAVVHFPRFGFMSGRTGVGSLEQEVVF